MKRYTLKVQLLNDSITNTAVRAALEEILLRAQPSLIYRLGTMSAVAPDHLLVEIASDAKKDSLESQIKILESKLPVRIEELGWGWIAGQEGSSPADAEAVLFPMEKKFHVLRYSLVLGLPLLMIGLILATLLFQKLKVQEFIFWGIYIVWLLLWNDYPLNYRLHAKRVECSPHELAVTYWFRKEIIHLTWDRIWGLELKGRTCIIYNNQEPVRFHISSRLNTIELNRLLRTIAGRASLNDVDSGIGKVIFKRFEAP